MQMTVSAGGAVDGIVVNDDQLAVARHLYVKFHGANAQAAQMPETGKGVLGGFTARAAVTQDFHRFREPGRGSARRRCSGPALSSAHA